MQRPNPFWHPVLSSSLEYALDTGHKAFHSVLEIHLFYGVLQKSANSLSSRLSVKSVTPQIVRAPPAEGKQAWLLNVERVIVKTSGFKFAPNRKFPTQSKATAPLPGLSRRTELKPFPFPLWQRSQQLVHWFWLVLATSTQANSVPVQSLLLYSRTQNGAWTGRGAVWFGIHQAKMCKNHKPVSQLYQILAGVEMTTMGPSLWRPLLGVCGWNPV